MAREKKVLLPQKTNVAYDELVRMGMPNGERFALKTFEKYRILQDRLFSSYFDKLNNNGEMPELPFDNNDK